MTDYGHELRFGVFITPQSDRPEHVVDLAQQAERAGLDLVTFMDHPYQPALLDTWTLISFVAARTERVHLSGYVLNLPSRPPAVLARAAASLDRLSSGRVELGIGPGDTFAAGAVAANGGARRTAPEAVEALSEAIDVIRGIWNAKDVQRLTVEGRHYQVQDVARGPEPVHNIGIWVPAGGPRMRRLVGQKADGWIAGGAWISDVETEVDRGNEAIDAAAVAAGRDPRDIRRIWDFEVSSGTSGRGMEAANANRWTERLLPLALVHGMSTFILISNHAATIHRFGNEVAPALREAVEYERRATHNAR
jgi:alkanesulfonate monooxygenase SsuD/methylene tetrahydromethanopterin reductase-like flavin-dependent oxidoreductase (luciferase family)